VSKPHDIEAIISGVRSAVPNVEITQMHRTHPADDDGLWWFRLPQVSRNIQIESSTYDCPFIVEHNGMTSDGEASRACSVAEAVSAIVDYLRSISTV
jgi:hypothetical protein